MSGEEKNNDDFSVRDMQNSTIIHLFNYSNRFRSWRGENGGGDNAKYVKQKLKKQKIWEETKK